MAFDNIQSAIDFKIMNNLMSANLLPIIRCSATGVRVGDFVSMDTCNDDILEFWRDQESDRRIAAPHGTLFCDSITPLEMVG